MGKIFIPSQSTRRWTGPYLGNYYGNLWKTFNVDLDRQEGKVGLSRRLVRVADTTDSNSDTLGTIDAFVRSNADCSDRWWALSENGPLYRVVGASPTVPSDSWEVDTLASSPTDAKDMAVFENDSRQDSGRNQLFVTRDTTIAVLNDTGGNTWDANWWTTTKSNVALRSGVPHPIEYFPLRRITLVGDANQVHTISRTSDTVNETTTARRLILPGYLQVEHIFTTTNRAWILCSHLYGGNGKVVEWDGSAETYNDIHDAYSTKPLSGIGFREVPLVVNDRGMVLEFTGRGFEPMSRNGQTVAFPIFEEQGNFFEVPKRGMASGDGLVYIHAAHPNATSYRQTAGIWCLNPTTGRLYPKHQIGQWGDTDYGEQAVSDVGALYSLPTTAATSRTLLIGGATITNLAGAAQSGIWVLDNAISSTATRGYFITQYIPASDVQDFFDTLWVRFKRFATTTNRIVIKARGVRPLMGATTLVNQANITWTGTTTFTVTLGATADALAIGDEVEVVSGDNAGLLAHITVISGAHAAQQTITIDETAVSSTAIGTARFERWKKLGIISDASKYEDSVNVGITSSFVQFKVELRGPYLELEVSDLLATVGEGLKAQN